MFNYIIYRIGQFIALIVPLKIGYKIAVFFSDLHYLFAYNDRRIVKDNLRAIFPEKPVREIKDIAIRVFRNFAKYLVDFFRFSKLNKEYIAQKIKIENIHYLDHALTKGKGAVILTAHLGNWELGGVSIALLGYPFWVVALPHKDKRVDNFFNFQRESKGVKVIPLGRAVRASLNALKENKFLALVGDRDFSQRGIIIDFFGKPTILPEGPAAFSLKTGAAIIPGFMLRNKDDSFTLRMEAPLEPAFKDNQAIVFTQRHYNDADLKELMIRYKKIMEDYIRKYPDQWYMFRRFWNEDVHNNSNV